MVSWLRYVAGRRPQRAQLHVVEYHRTNRGIILLNFEKLARRSLNLPGPRYGNM
jgi:hypothetical protein